MGNKSREILETMSMTYFYCKIIIDDNNKVKDLIIEESNYDITKITEDMQLVFKEKGILKFNMHLLKYLINILNNKSEHVLECLEIKNLSKDYIVLWYKKDNLGEINKLKNENYNRKFSKHLKRKKENAVNKFDYDIYDLDKVKQFREIDKKNIKTPCFHECYNISEYIRTSNDICYEKIFENRFMKNKKAVFNILNYLDDVVIIKDKKKILFINDAFERLYGISINEINESNEVLVAYDRIHPDDKKLFKNINYDEPLDKVARIIRKDNEIRWAWFRSNPIKDENNNTLRIVIIINDITNKMNEEMELDKLKRDFFANLSHEFKTPINVIATSLQLLNFKIKNSEIINKYDYLTYINSSQNNVFRMIKLINNLIDSVEIEAGFFRYNPKFIEIVSFIEEICIKASKIAIKKSIEIIFDTQIEEKIILCDLEHMERVILNILSNAIKFSENPGKIEVYIFSKNGMLEIKIKDNGIGISKDNLEFVFDRFKIINNRMTKISEGFGIGLYIAKKLAIINKGDIEISSELGVGTEVIVKIPDILDENYNLECALTEINNIDYLGVDRMKIEFSDIYL